MNELRGASFIAFSDSKRIATGDLRTVAEKAKAAIDRDPWARILIFDAVTSESIELDLRGTAREVINRLDERTILEARAPEEDESVEGARRPGRPKLGVVAREVTLLPRHWEWLASQPGGASVALRKLVERARLDSRDVDRVRRAQEAAYRFISVMAGNEAGFEEAMRALYANDPERFKERAQCWPVDIKEHAMRLTASVFQQEDES